MLKNIYFNGDIMNYIDLLRYSYKDKNEYIAEYKKRFYSTDAIKLNFKINDNQAFFVQNTYISNLMFNILRADKNISNISWRLPDIAHEQFSKRCLIDEIVLTNKIEGVNSTRREIASILNELEGVVQEKAARRRFWGLVNQYKKLGKKEHISLKTCEDIRILYDEIVLSEVIEENPKNAPDGKLFRKDSTSIYTSTDTEIHRGTYPESAIIAELEEALEFLNNESFELLYRVSIFHYLMGYIHPFYDGNGRLGRFIVFGKLKRVQQLKKTGRNMVHS
jgi:Fic family protein